MVKYSYDLAGRTTQIERSEPPLPSGNPPTIPAFASFLTTTFSYRDAQGKKTTRIQSMSHTAPNSTLASSTLLASYSLGWDPGGRLVSMTSTADDAATFTYDRTDQLKSATYDKPAYADLHFSYDANGNRTGGGNIPGPDNRQTSDGVSDFTYDLDGNMTRRTNKTTGAVVEYAWDLRNRLTDVTFKSSASSPATKKVHYTYDALNRRIGKSVDTDGNGTQDQVDWFANRGLRTDRENAGDEVMLRMNASGNVTSRYLHGASVDEILAEENIAADGTRDVLWPLTDQQGSVRDIARRGADGRATIVNHVMYGPFGEKVAETDTAIAHMYGYTGREYDQETGLQYNRARYYDPKLGRFISQDPMSFDAGDANLYRMTGNHATYASDPSGLEKWDPQVVWAAIKTADPELAELMRYHVDLFSTQDNTPKIGYSGNSKRYINAQYPENWSNQQVIDSIFKNSWTFSNSDLLDYVNQAASDYGRTTNPMGDSPAQRLGKSEADLLREDQRTRYREAVGKIAPLIVDTMRNFPLFGEGAYAAFMIVDGRVFEYGKGIVTDTAQTAKFFTELAKNHPAEAITTGVVVVVVGGKYVVRKIDDIAPNKVNGRTPINADYVGKTYFDALPRRLQKKYPNGVKFDAKGFPDFSPYSKKSVDIKYTGSRTGDYDAANKAAGFSETPKGYTWHHHQDVGANGVGRMELVPSDLHGEIRHTGGVARWQELFPGQGSY